MADVYVLVAVDAGTIVESSKTFGTGSVDNPTNLGAWGESDNYIYMIAKRSYAVTGEGKSELMVQVEVGDTIHWQFNTLSKGMHYSVIPYKINISDTSVVEEPRMLDIQVGSYMPTDTSNPTGDRKMVTYEDCELRAAALKLGGHVQYTCWFMLVDRDNQVQGYYSWDPFIDTRSA